MGRASVSNSLAENDFGDSAFKPKVMEKQFDRNRDYANLSPNFRKIFENEKGSDITDIRIPISGYGGHRKGKIAENLHGKTERVVGI
jgi:hypothetical protein